MSPVDRFPGGYLVFGDAVCSFNPIYGQGMSAAALQATALDKCLRAGDAALAKRFFAAASKVIDGAVDDGGWRRSAAMTASKAREAAMVKFVNWYIGKLHIAAAGDPIVARRVSSRREPARIRRPA